MKNLILTMILIPAMAVAAYATHNNELEKEPFSEERFEKLQAKGAVILVDVFADWCGTCAKQQELIKQYRNENPDKEFYILEVDFDRDKKYVRKLRAPRQSTLLVFQGENQFWYSVAETRYEVIAREMDKAFAAKS
ncbi:MAG: thioredoxin domain-containing protein [Balneolaceae bacterium]